MSTAKPITAELSHLANGDSHVRKRVFASLPLKKVALCVGDLTVINVALFLALMVRDLWFPESHGVTKHFLVWDHFLAFNILHSVWLFVFYSVGLYDIERFESRLGLARKIVLAVVICGVLGVVLFYAISYFKVTPKVFRMPPRSALAIDLTFLSVLLFASRELFIRWGRNGSPVRVMLCGKGAELTQFKEFVDQHRHLGYQVCDSVLLENSPGDLLSLQNSIQVRFVDKQIDVIAVSHQFASHQSMQVFFYKLLCSGAHVADLSHLYEEVTGKIPTSLINEAWFVGVVRAFNKRGFETVKRLVDLSVACALGIPTLVLFPLVALLIKVDSPGPIMFRQRRVGKGGNVFEVVKFRTMIDGAESEGAPRWAVKGDSRITRFGGFLRRTRIDELPQLWNVVRGEMSLVGPRPERPEFVAELNAQIPFFETRSLVRPGLTGWAQINFGYGSSVEDAHEKLQYDLYYIKHRSVGLDISILLRTLSTILRYEGR